MAAVPVLTQRDYYAARFLEYHSYDRERSRDMADDMHRYHPNYKKVDLRRYFRNITDPNDLEAAALLSLIKDRTRQRRKLHRSQRVSDELTIEYVDLRTYEQSDAIDDVAKEFFYELHPRFALENIEIYISVVEEIINDVDGVVKEGCQHFAQLVLEYYCIKKVNDCCLHSVECSFLKQNLKHHKDDMVNDMVRKVEEHFEPASANLCKHYLEEASKPEKIPEITAAFIQKLMIPYDSKACEGELQNLYGIIMAKEWDPTAVNFESEFRHMLVKEFFFDAATKINTFTHVNARRQVHEFLEGKDLVNDYYLYHYQAVDS